MSVLSTRLRQARQAMHPEVQQKDIEKRLAKDDRDFADMLEQTGHMLKQTATYIESQQIYNVVRTLQSKVQARRDANIADPLRPIQEAFDDAEFKELVDLI